MSVQALVAEIKNAIEAIPGTTYIVAEKRVDPKIVADTQLPAVIISTVDTSFAQQNYRSVVETHEVNLLILVKDDAVTEPLTMLGTAQAEILTALFSSFISGAGCSIILKESFELKTSSISNAVKQYEFGSAVSCILGFRCKICADY